jgi:hypothetical protein
MFFGTRLHHFRERAVQHGFDQGAVGTADVPPLRPVRNVHIASWQKRGAGRKQPYFIRPRDGGLFSFTGLWERWRDPQGETVETCTILTTGANDLMRSLHDRMPVILVTTAEARWIDACADAASLTLAAGALPQCEDGSLSGESLGEQPQAREAVLPGGCWRVVSSQAFGFADGLAGLLHFSSLLRYFR